MATGEAVETPARCVLLEKLAPGYRSFTIRCIKDSSPHATIAFFLQAAKVVAPVHLEPCAPARMGTEATGGDPSVLTADRNL
jgi:hypothetical protein